MNSIDHFIPFSSSSDAPIGTNLPMYRARLHHLEAIRMSLLLVEDALLNDLAKLYRLKAAGQPVEIPNEITVKDVVVRLS
jgi:hypothetical protein